MAQRTLIQERRNRILDYINKNQKADIKELSELLNATEITIRRDLIELEKKKQLIRTHGGAILNEQKKSVWQTSSIYNRLERNREKKERIAQFSATLIRDDESLFIDGGSTNQILAPLVKDRRNMLFVTNSPDVADILLENEENRIIQIGGELTRDTHLTIGPDAEDNIRKYYVDKCITSVSGIDPDVGLRPVGCQHRCDRLRHTKRRNREAQGQRHNRLCRIKALLNKVRVFAHFL